ncbi:MAG: flagellar export protein FliJ [Gammaproteobacteria bacterium]
MKKSDRLKTIVELNAAQEKKALEAFGAVQKRQLQTLQQLENLTQYRREYQEKFDAHCSRGLRVNQLIEFRSFMAKLDTAIAGQERMLEQVEAELNSIRGNWLGLHNRTKSLQKICDSAVAAELKEVDKQEQLEQDDRVSSNGRRKEAGGMRNADNS